MIDLDDFSRLTHFLVRCIDEETLGGLRLRRDHKDDKLVTPWEKIEPLLGPNSAEVCIVPSTDEDKKFFSDITHTATQSARIHYGYPLRFRKDGYLSPLFFIEVDIKAGDNGEYKLFPVWRSLGVNVLLLIEAGFSQEEADLLASELDGDFGSFAARLKAAAEVLELPQHFLDSDELETLPKYQSGQDAWYKTPILFQANINRVKKSLHFELSQFIKQQYLQQEVPKTALGTLFGLSEMGIEVKKQKIHRFEISPLNNQQAEAVDCALTAPLTVVTGPPGTGKSQVVVNILSNCVASGQTVLFASNNNTPLEEVRKRLAETMGDAGDWALRLGNKEYRAAAKATMPDQLSDPIKLGDLVSSQDVLSQLHTLGIERDIYERELADIEKNQTEIETVLEQERRFSSALPEDWTNAVESNAPQLVNGKSLRKVSDDIHALAGKKNGGLLLQIRKLLLGERLVRDTEEELRALYAELPEEIQTMTFADQSRLSIDGLLLAVLRLEQHMKWEASRQRRHKTETHLAASRPIHAIERDLALIAKKRVVQGRDLLRIDWTEKLQKKSGRVKDGLKRYFDYLERKFEPGKNKEFYRGFEESIHTAAEGLPVWIVTNLSVGDCLPLQPALFDCVVIDEASQSDLASIIPLLFRARRAVLVGDPKQLAHIPGITPKQEERIADELSVSDLISDWSLINRSAYDIGASAVMERGDKELLLSQHYRCHPEIIGFSNIAFYEGRLIAKTAKMFPKDAHEIGMHWHHVDGRLATTKRSAANEAEIEEITCLVGIWATDMPRWQTADTTIGVVTPFRLQADSIRAALENQPWWPQVKDRITIGTAHTFQGSECDVMVFSPVVTNGLRQHLTNFVAHSDKLLNVAITRAKTALYVVGDRPCCQDAGGALSTLVSYVEATKSSRCTRTVPASEAELEFRKILDDLNITYQEEYEVHRRPGTLPYRLDFMVVSNSGVRYDLEVDGRYHLSNERFQEDAVRNKFLEAMNFKVLRFPAREVFNNKDAVRERLLRLV